ncbi:MAG: SDR family NAD(P)-dependent oxidoreductase [Gemmataceae bacterium]
MLINNAGIGATGHFADADPDRLRKIFEVNFFGTTETTRACLPLLREGRTPAILNVSSIAARCGLPARSRYWQQVRRPGVQRGGSAPGQKDGIDVLLVNPGLTQTNFSKNMLEQKAKVQMDHLRGMTADEVARLTLDARPGASRGDVHHQGPAARPRQPPLPVVRLVGGAEEGPPAVRRRAGGPPRRPAMTRPGSFSLVGPNGAR